MSAMELLHEVRRMGGDFIPLPGGRLRVRVPEPLPAPLVEHLRSSTRELLDALAGNSEPAVLDAKEWKAYFDERAAMRQFCSGIPRDTAEELAWDDTLGEWHRMHPLQFPPSQCAGCWQPIGLVRALHLHNGRSVHFDTLQCVSRYGEIWRAVAARSLKALGIEWPSVKAPR